MESARFFFVDRGWTERVLIEGALSVGAVTDADRAILQEVYPAVRDDLDQAERSVRVPGGEQAEVGSADGLTGDAHRSQAVSGWPGLHVRAYRNISTSIRPKMIPAGSMSCGCERPGRQRPPGHL